MHFNAESVSQKMIFELISSVNDICMHYGLCDYLGKLKQDDLDSRQDSASIVLTSVLCLEHLLLRTSQSVLGL